MGSDVPRGTRPARKPLIPLPVSPRLPPTPRPLRVHRSTWTSLKRIPAPARHPPLPDPGAARSTWNTSRPERPHRLPSTCRTGSALQFPSPCRRTCRFHVEHPPALSASLPHRVPRPQPPPFPPDGGPLFHVEPLRQEFFPQCPTRSPGLHPEHLDPSFSPRNRCSTWNPAVVRGRSSGKGAASEGSGPRPGDPAPAGGGSERGSQTRRRTPTPVRAQGWLQLPGFPVPPRAASGQLRRDVPRGTSPRSPTSPTALPLLAVPLPSASGPPGTAAALAVPHPTSPPAPFSPSRRRADSATATASGVPAACPPSSPRLTSRRPREHRAPPCAAGRRTDSRPGKPGRGAGSALPRKHHRPLRSAEPEACSDSLSALGCWPSAPPCSRALVFPLRRRVRSSRENRGCSSSNGPGFQSSGAPACSASGAPSASSPPPTGSSSSSSGPFPARGCAALGEGAALRAARARVRRTRPESAHRFGPAPRGAPRWQRSTWNTASGGASSRAGLTRPRHRPA
jgi:hypothetical protein